MVLSLRPCIMTSSLSILSMAKSSGLFPQDLTVSLCMQIHCSCFTLHTSSRVIFSLKNLVIFILYTKRLILKPLRIAMPPGLHIPSPHPPLLHFTCFRAFVTIYVFPFVFFLFTFIFFNCSHTLHPDCSIFFFLSSHYLLAPLLFPRSFHLLFPTKKGRLARESNQTWPNKLQQYLVHPYILKLMRQPSRRKVQLKLFLSVVGSGGSEVKNLQCSGRGPNSVPSTRIRLLIAAYNSSFGASSASGLLEHPDTHVHTQRILKLNIKKQFPFQESLFRSFLMSYLNEMFLMICKLRPDHSVIVLLSNYFPTEIPVCFVQDL